MNLKYSKNRAKKKTTGFSLVEIVVALGIMSFSVVAILGLFSLGLDSVGDSEAKLAAANVASELLERWKSDPTRQMEDMPISSIYNIEALSQNPPSSSTVEYIDESGRKTSQQEAKFRLEYRIWNASATEGSAATTFVRIQLQLFWPAASKTITPNNTYEVMTTVRVNRIEEQSE
ncbi:MAG: hypothetical protein AAGA18_05540 [Verrucomicrobiota bacterium]